MRTKKVVLDYSGMKDDELHTIIGKVMDCLEGHSLFTELPVTLETLEEHALDFRLKLEKAVGGSLLEIAEKNDAKALLAEDLKDIAFYVNKMAKGSRSLLLSSGLQLEADPTKSQTPDVVKGARITDGRQRDQFNVLFEPLKNALLYDYEVADSLDEDGQPDWKFIYQTSTSRGNIFAPTVPDRIYYLRVRARNKRGIGDWSDTVSLKAR